MANAYDVVFRERAVAAYESGEGAYGDVPALFWVGHRPLERWVTQWRATGAVTLRPKGGGWRCPIERAARRAVGAEAADGTSAAWCRVDHRRVLRAQRTTPTSVRRALHRAGVVLKTHGRGRARSTGRMSAPSARRA